MKCCEVTKLFSQVAVIFVIASLCNTSSAYRLLLLPTSFQSHINYFVPLAQGIKDAGHEPYMILSEQSTSFIEQMKSQGIAYLTYRAPEGICHTSSPQFHKIVADTLLNYQRDNQKVAGVIAPAVSKECDNFLTDEGLFKKASIVNFDLAVVDGLYFARCLYMFPSRLQIPYVTMTTFQDIWPARIPAMPSFVPFHYGDFTVKMNFKERLANTMINVLWSWSSRNSPPLSKAIKASFVDRPEIIADFDNLMMYSKLWLFNTDLSLDYAKPTMPNVIYIGGLSVGPAKPLQNEIQTFMDSYPQGVIIVSFGSVIVDIPDNINRKLLETFRKLNYGVLWRNKDTQGLDIPKNVKALKWLPQNDALGHKNTKAFVTHCGNNGQFEAVYHRVPLVGLPIFVDQPYNCNRMKFKGFGTWLDFYSFTADDLVREIEMVVDNDTMAANLKRGSDLFIDQFQTPRQRAAYWLEHVIKHGDSHLKSEAVNLYWYQYFLVDVILFIITALAISVTVLALCVRFCIRKYMTLFSPKKQKEN